MRALANWILKEKLGFVEIACEKPNIHIGFARELLLEKLFYGWIVDSMTFKYRRKITITEQSGSDLTDYQVLIELNSTNFDFTHTQTNGEDIRFTDANGNLLSYWIEEWDAVNESAKVWVKVPSIPANSEVEIFMYYGNPTLMSESNGDAVFDFFDDFEGTSIDTSKWERTHTGGSTSVSDSVVSISASNGAWEGWKAPAYQFGAGLIYESKKKFSATDNGMQIDGLSDFGTTTFFGNDALLHNFEVYHNQVRTYNDGSATTNDMTNLEDKSEVWHIIRIIWKSTTEAVFEVLNEDYSLDTTITHTTNVPDANNLVPFFRGSAYSDNSCTHYWDWIRVRKYTEPEPSVSLGAEETA